MPTSHTQRLVKQAAQTAKLLGVDFVPCFRAGNLSSDLAPPAESTAPAHSLEEQPMPAAMKSKRSRPKVQKQLDEILARYEAEAPHEAFVTDHHSIVFGDGDPCAQLMFIGEAPGAEEDKAGIPFVGRAGKLLNKMIDAMGLSREKVYIANVLKTRPPNNATPTIEESRLCAPFLYEQIQVVQPRVIVTLGLPATRLILESTATMGSLRGQWGSFTDPAGREVPVMPTYHPAYLLRAYSKENRAKVWSDLQMAMEKIDV